MPGHGVQRHDVQLAFVAPIGARAHQYRLAHEVAPVLEPLFGQFLKMVHIKNLSAIRLWLGLSVAVLKQAVLSFGGAVSALRTPFDVPRWFRIFHRP